MYDVFGRDAQDAITRSLELPLTTRVGARSLGMIAAIDFHNQPRRRCEKIDDALANDSLATKSNAELAAAQGLPQPGFGEGRVRAHLASAIGEQFGASRIERTRTHAELLCPGMRPGVALLRRICDARKPCSAEQCCAAQSVRASRSPAAFAGKGGAVEPTELSAEFAITPMISQTLSDPREAAKRVSPPVARSAPV